MLTRLCFPNKASLKHDTIVKIVGNLVIMTACGFSRNRRAAAADRPGLNE